MLGISKTLMREFKQNIAIKLIYAIWIQIVS